MRRVFYRFGRPAVILAASVVFGAGISLFLTPGGLVPGGVNGISIIINKLTGLKVGTLSFLINIPLLITALYKFGKGFFWDTLFSLAACSAATDLFSLLPPITDDVIACSLAGGALSAVGVGTIMRCGSTTGGSDIIVKLIKQRFMYIKTGVIFFILDSAVAFLSGIVFGDWRIVVYSLLTITVSGFTMNKVLYGSDEAKLLFVVCNNCEEVVNALVDGLEAGVSTIDAVGGYTHHSRKIVMCAIRKQNLYKAKELIYSKDRTAFMIVSSATAIYGMGFKSYEDSEL